VVRQRTFPEPVAVSSVLQRLHVGDEGDGLAVIDDTTLLYAQLRCHTLLAVSFEFPKISHCSAFSKSLRFPRLKLFIRGWE